MPNLIESYRLTRFGFPRDRIIGDSQVRIDATYMCVLELFDSAGRTGTGFFFAGFHPLPNLAELNRMFEEEVAPVFIGQNPHALTNRISRPRGGNIRPLPFNVAEAIDQAAWDLKGQELGLPLYRLLGGTEPRVRTYASGLDFHLSDADMTNLFGQAALMGFNAFKVKVGHPELDWDIHRLKLVREVVGVGATMMVDANEAWSPAEAVRRLHAYRQAGFDIYWIEDPCLRLDFDGLRQISRQVPFTLVNTGEYLGLSDKRRLIESGAVDILNIHGNITDDMHAGWLAHDHGLQVSIGNTSLEVGVHVAAALPASPWLEYSFLNWNFIVENPLRFENGWAIASDVPGHGLKVSEAARAKYAQPEIVDLTGLEAPPALISLKWP
jgi:L-alanine-DL-glutamate epimerase-like enolase superfamily enzyme